jgi:transglutaminase-like putative cysteine protease
MNLSRATILLVMPALATAAFATSDAALNARTFEIRYAAVIPAPPPGAQRLRAWLPYPQSDAWQTIDAVVVSTPFRHEVHHDSEYGNSVLFLESQPPPEDRGQVVMSFTVTRREYVNRPDRPHPQGANQVDPKLLERFRQPDKLVPLQGKIAEVAREVTRDAHTESEKARAIYDYVSTHLHYDKSGTGWGRGDAIWACDNKRGNCTDFHSLLIGMARSVGIPAKFEIGLPVPEGQAEGTIGGYHCWAAFYLNGIGWVPVDSSEASKFPAKRDYFFGALDANRVRLSVGRDVTLDPAQQGGPINYLVYPYVEVDGRPLDGVTQTFSFREVDHLENP